MDKSQERQEHGKKMLSHPSVSVGLDVIRECLELRNPLWSYFVAEAVQQDRFSMPHVAPHFQK